MSNYLAVERVKPDEVFSLIPGTDRFFVSNYGRALKTVLDKDTDTIIERLIPIFKTPNKTKRLYSDIYIYLNNEYCRVRLHRAMAKTFLDSSLNLFYNKDKRVVNHIDNNSQNNHISNLEIMTQSENIRAAMDMGIKVGSYEAKECYAYNVKTNELRNYKFVRELCRDIFKTDNAGRFNHNYKCKSISKEGWRVGYTESEARGE